MLGVEALVDPISRHPFPFVPVTEVHLKPIRNVVDCHHIAFPGSSPLLQGTGGLAVRNAIGLMTDWKTHHLRWHRERQGDRYRERHGPPLPDNDGDRCRYIAFALAKYLDQGICFRGGAHAVSLNNRQRQRLRESGEMGVINEAAVRDFVVSHVMDMPLAEADQPAFDWFLRAESPQEVRVRGHELLALKVRSAVQDFAEDYHTAHQEGLLDPSAPPRASQLIHDVVGHFGARDQIVSLMFRNGPVDQQG